jgi:F420-0:gamma-glutamyl ligase
VFLDRQRVRQRARALARKFQISPELTQIVVNEADGILGGGRGFLLALKLGILSPNAGVDIKNSPPGTATLWPRNPEASADIIRRSLGKMSQARIGVLIVDSRLTPLRLGTTGLSIGSSGFKPVKDDRRKNDLFHRSVKVTQMNVADDLAASSHLLMAECNERVGLVVIRNAPISMAGGHSSRAKLDMRKCLVCSNLVR